MEFDLNSPHSLLKPRCMFIFISGTMTLICQIDAGSRESQRKVQYRVPEHPSRKEHWEFVGKRPGLTSRSSFQQNGWGCLTSSFRQTDGSVCPTITCSIWIQAKKKMNCIMWNSNIFTFSFSLKNVNSTSKQKYHLEYVKINTKSHIYNICNFFSMYNKMELS